VGLKHQVPRRSGPVKSWVVVLDAIRVRIGIAGEYLLTSGKRRYAKRVDVPRCQRDSESADVEGDGISTGGRTEDLRNRSQQGPSESVTAVDAHFSCSAGTDKLNLRIS